MQIVHFIVRIVHLVVQIVHQLYILSLVFGIVGVLISLRSRCPATPRLNERDQSAAGTYRRDVVGDQIGQIRRCTGGPQRDQPIAIEQIQNTLDEAQPDTARAVRWSAGVHPLKSSQASVFPRTSHGPDQTARHSGCASARISCATGRRPGRAISLPRTPRRHSLWALNRKQIGRSQCTGEGRVSSTTGGGQVRYSPQNTLDVTLDAALDEDQADAARTPR